MFIEVFCKASATPGLAKKGFVMSPNGLLAPDAMFTFKVCAGSITSTLTKSSPKNALASPSDLANIGCATVCLSVADLHAADTSSFFFIRSS